MEELRRVDLRKALLLALYAYAAFWGAVQAVSANALVIWLGSVLFALLAAGWCAVDARKLGTPLMPVVQMIVFLFWPIAVPIYLIWSRGFRGLGYTLLHAVGLSVVAGTADFLTLSILEGLLAS